MPNPRPYLSIITPVYNTGAYLEPFHERISAAASAITPYYEIIFVNDGSPDASLPALQALRQRDPHVEILDLSRNFGQHRAIFAGLAAARGEMAFVIDSDLEESPEWLGEYYRAMNERKVDVVYGYQQARKGGLLEKTTGYASFWVVNHVFKMPYRKNVVTATLMTRRFLNNLLKFNDNNAIFSVFCYLTGFSSHALVVDKQQRGRSSYTLRKRLAHFLDYVVAITAKPLLWPAWAGAAFTAAGAAIGIHALFTVDSSHFYDKIMIAAILITGGCILLALGVFGLYLSTVLANVRQRPRVIIKQPSAFDATE